MLKKRMLGGVSLGVVIALVLSALPVAATVGPAGDGRTHVTDTECTIQLIVPVQEVHISGDTDTVTVPMNVQWFDGRNPGPPQPPRITHYFRENTTYDGGGDVNTGKETTGGMMQPGTDRLSFDVTATKGETMYVLYSVRVYYTQNSTTLCSQALLG